MKLPYIATAFIIGQYRLVFSFIPPPTACCNSVSKRMHPSHPSTLISLSYAADSDIELDANTENTIINTNPQSTNSELALLLPGQTLRIQIGDINQSRKAWKKRRRNTSPILIPCSILGMNREWMVRYNIMTILHQIGEPSSFVNGQVGATVGKISRAYKKKLHGDLRIHATELGYDSVESLILNLFDERITAEYGISTFMEKTHDNLMVVTSLTRRQARSFSSNAGLVHFRPETEDDGYILEGNEKMIHTGMANVRLSSSIGKMPKYTTEPLGAAIRVSPYDEAAKRYQQGDELNAFVYSYDTQGDNESPLLVLTADDPRGKGVALGGTGTFGTSTRVRGKGGSGNIPSGDLVEDSSIERELNSLSVGDGPYDATVVALSEHSNSAFVDCAVGRKRGKKFGGGVIKVLGMLRFEDMLEGMEEEQEIKAGDDVQVYIKTVSPQSGRFMVTLDASIKNKKAKEIKLEKQADKRLSRLEKQISHEDIESLIGNVYDGIVKAKSKTGNWYYVQPCVESDEVENNVGESCIPSMPVGVASFEEEDDNQKLYESGDNVRVRLEGIDEKRGQLALTLISL